MVRKKITARQINLLVGNIWFDVKVKKENLVRFRTPTMTAAIRGTSGKFKVSLDGNTNYGLATGHAETIGKFEEIINPKSIEQSYVKAKNLPKSDPLIDNSPIQEKVVESLKSFEKSDTLALEAEKAKKFAELAALQAEKLNTQAARLHAVEAAAQAAMAKSKAKAAEVEAFLKSEQEKVIEANRFGVEEEVESATESLQDVSKTLEAAKIQVDQDKKVATEIKEEIKKTTKNKKEIKKENKIQEIKPKQEKETKKPLEDSSSSVSSEPELAKKEFMPKVNVPLTLKKQDQMPPEISKQDPKKAQKAKEAKKEVSWFQKIINSLREKLNRWRGSL